MVGTHAAKSGPDTGPGRPVQALDVPHLRTRCFPQLLPTAASHRCFPPLLPTAASHSCFPQLLPTAASHRFRCRVCVSPAAVPVPEHQAYVPASLPSLLATAPLATYIAQVLDPIQGPRGLALIVLVTVMGAGMATWLTTVILYVVSSMVSRAAGDAMIGVLYTPICGFYAGVVGLLVGVKQAIPGELTIKDYKFNTAVLPLAYIGVLCPVQMVWGRMVNILIILYGFVVAWGWLRYFHPSGVAGLVGDPSDQFKLLSFLPEAMQKHAMMRAFSDRCDERMRAWAELAKDLRGMLAGSRGGQSDARVGSSAPVERSTSGDSTRRRERGLKSLEARLGDKDSPASDAV